MAVKANITIDQGTDFDATIDLSDAGGVPVNLTGYSVYSQMRKNYAASSPAATFQTSHNNEAGQITLVLPSTDYQLTDSNNNVITHPGTTSLEPGRYLYDVEIQAPQVANTAGKISRVVEGTVTVTPGITRT